VADDVIGGLLQAAQDTPGGKCERRRLHEELRDDGTQNGAEEAVAMHKVDGERDVQDSHDDGADDLDSERADAIQEEVHRLKVAVKDAEGGEQNEKGG